MKLFERVTRPIVFKPKAFNLTYFLRGLAVIGVILFHAAYPVLQVDPFFSSFLTGNVHASLRLFFMLSGFTLGMGFIAGKYRQDLVSVLKFWYRRIIRLAPIYYLTVFYLWTVTGGAARENIYDLIRLLTFRSSPQTSVHMAGFLWFVSTLVKFYLVAPLGFAVINLIKKAKPDAFLWLFFVAGLTGTVVRILLINRISYELMYSSFRMNLDVFLQGLMLAGAVSSIRSLHTGIRKAVYVLFLPSYVLFWVFGSLAGQSYAADVSRSPFAMAWLPLAAIALAGCFIYTWEQQSGERQTGAGRYIQYLWAVIMYIGIYSLEIYIFHVLLIDRQNMYCFAPCGATKYLSHFIYLLTVAFVMAVLFHWGVERIATRLSRKTESNGKENP